MDNPSTSTCRRAACVVGTIFLAGIYSTGQKFFSAVVQSGVVVVDVVDVCSEFFSRDAEGTHDTLHKNLLYKLLLLNLTPCTYLHTLSESIR